MSIETRHYGFLEFEHRTVKGEGRDAFLERVTKLESKLFVIGDKAEHFAIGCTPTTANLEWYCFFIEETAKIQEKLLKVLAKLPIGPRNLGVSGI